MNRYTHRYNKEQCYCELCEKNVKEIRACLVPILPDDFEKHVDGDTGEIDIDSFDELYKVRVCVDCYGSDRVKPVSVSIRGIHRITPATKDTP